MISCYFSKGIYSRKQELVSVALNLFTSDTGANLGVINLLKKGENYFCLRSASMKWETYMSKTYHMIIFLCGVSIPLRISILETL